MTSETFILGEAWPWDSVIGNKGARWPGSSEKDWWFYVSLWLNSRPQACNLYVKPSIHHPLKCFSEVAASLGPGSRGAQADFTRPWSFPPHVDHHCLSHCLVAFILAMGAVASWEALFPDCSSDSLIKDGVTLYLGDFWKFIQPLWPHLLTFQPIVVFPSTWLDAGRDHRDAGANQVWTEGPCLPWAFVSSILAQLDLVIKTNTSSPSRNTSKIALKYIDLHCSLWESF